MKDSISIIYTVILVILLITTFTILPHEPVSLNQTIPIPSWPKDFRPMNDLR